MEKGERARFLRRFISCHFLLLFWGRMTLLVDLLSICFTALFCSVAKINFLNVKSEREREGAHGAADTSVYLQPS